MNRKLTGTLVLSGLLFFLLIASLSIAKAAPISQETQSADQEDAEVEVVASLPMTMEMSGEPLSQPLTITIHQRLPISINLGQLGLTSEGVTITGALPLALLLTIDFTVTDTLTSTVPSTVSLIHVGDALNRLPVTMTLSDITSTLVVIAPQPLPEETDVMTETESLTETGEISATPGITITPDITTTTPITPEIEATPTVTVTPTVTTTPPLTETPEATATATVTVEATPEAPEIAPTSNVTANLRSGPATTFDLVGTASLGEELDIVAISEDAQWYLLSSGEWIFAELVSDPPSDSPIATQALIDEVNAEAAAREEAEEEATPEPVAEPTATPEPTAEPIIVATSVAALVPTATPVSAAPTPSANIDANLRAGPGTQYDVVGGTITGEELDIVGQDATGEWYLLSNGGWIANFLINNPPTDAPIVADDASPLLNGETINPILVPTPAPGSETAETATAVDQEVPLGLAENLYLDEVRTLIARYDLAGDAILQLVAAAQADNAMVQDAAWQEEMNTAIATVRRTGQQIRSLEPPPLFGAAQIDLRSATGAFDLAATLLEEGLNEGAMDKLDQALVEADTGRALLQSAQEKVSAVAQ